MFARTLALSVVLLAACDDNPTAVEQNPAQAEDSGVAVSDSAVAPMRDANSTPPADSALPVDSSRGMPNVVPYPACGGIAGLPCHAGELCNHETPPDGLGCGWEDSLGTCTSKTETCSMSEPVCGCDGVSYDSRCDAHAAGTSVKAAGACRAAGDTHCDESKALCKRARPDCPNGQVPAVVDGCWGECVGISECACQKADECPQREQYVCFMSAQHCGPYVN